jgi:syntaxin 1B/2/3
MPANETVQHAPNGMSNGQQTSITMSNPDFLARVEAVKAEIRNLTANISEIGTIHQRLLNDTAGTHSSSLENIVSQTQILNTRIKDQIKQLETDAAKSNKNQTKDSQIRTLKSNFKNQLEDYQREENNYRQRYKEQISRNYRIVNPEASDQEVREAADADWGNEGVFQTAVCIETSLLLSHC